MLKASMNQNFEPQKTLGQKKKRKRKRKRKSCGFSYQIH